MNFIENSEESPPQSVWKRALNRNEIRVKVGNFALSDELILNAGDYFATDEAGNPSPILKAGPIGGSAHFYSDARIRKLWGFDFKSRWSEGVPQDVKFSIRRSVIRELMRIFSVTQSRTFEYELYRELQEELAFENFPGRYERPVLQQSEANRIRTKYRWTIVFERPREEDEGFDVSINRFFEVDIPQKIRKKLREAGKVIFVPTVREMRQGEMKRDGEIIEISRKARMFYAFKKGRLRNFDKIADDWKK